MGNFAKWYIDILQKTMQVIISFFVGIGEFIANIFVRYPVNSFNSFTLATREFQLLDWVAAIVVVSVNIVFLVIILLLVFRLLKKYIRFVKREINTDNLIDEISELNRALIESTNEKNTILALKSEDLGLGSGVVSNRVKSSNLLTENIDGTDEEKNKNEDSRFVKLLDVDETYDYAVLPTHMYETDRINLNELVNRFINFSASKLKLFYTHKTVTTFLAGMASSKIIILEGISGTGKTSLPYAFGKFFNNDSSIISVQPSWRDRTEIIGYLNEFTKKYTEPDFLKAIYETTYRTDVNLIILDEMNLARVEYYFADFLSIMEMPKPEEWLIDIVGDSQPGDPINLKKGKMLLPQNVWFIGTANRDDSTFTITDKVYDRAASIEMNDRANYIDAPDTNNVHMSYEYLDGLFKQAVIDNPITTKTLENLEKLDLFITSKFQITFGNRIMRQIKSFIPVYVASGENEIDGLDYIVSRKVIRKFETLNLPFLVNELDELLKEIDKLFGKTKFNETRKMIEQFRKQV
ncbi:hypothetical protein [Haploplasma axanthum]|uniref:5-methylcytosine-specific restriction enzyme B n=1 Tax=Haploplasma axanthum TaxID=29552 RepID=A0A449BDX5_HAPAX|nr:hypothetical protein [Haploplasma axanthum]VEU80627.1 Uncharacterised protein [Haploplasma axanthum]